MNKKEIDIDNEIEKRWDDFYEWLHTCPLNGHSQDPQQVE